MGSPEIIVELDQWVRRRGCPQVLCADVAEATQSHELRAWCKERGVLQEFSPSYHHASSGFVESFNQTLLNQLRQMWVESPRSFATKVEQAVDVYNHIPRSRVMGPPKRMWHDLRKPGNFIGKTVGSAP